MGGVGTSGVDEDFVDRVDVFLVDLERERV